MTYALHLDIVECWATFLIKMSYSLKTSGRSWNQEEFLSPLQKCSHPGAEFLLVEILIYSLIPVDIPLYKAYPIQFRKFNAHKTCVWESSYTIHMHVLQMHDSFRSFSQTTYIEDKRVKIFLNCCTLVLGMVREECVPMFVYGHMKREIPAYRKVVF